MVNPLDYVQAGQQFALHLNC